MGKDSSLCSIEGCERARCSKLYCQKHYRAFKLYGDPVYLKNKPVGDVCSHPGCEKEPRVKGLCDKHYIRLKRNGSTFKTKHDPRDITVKQRIKRNIIKDDNGCWIWQKGKTQDGYGQISIGGEKRRTHCVSYEEWVGDIPEGKEVCHSCDVRGCCNPKHLFVATHKENIDDMIKKGRKASSSGSKNSNAQLTENSVKDIFFRISSGESVRDIAEYYGVGGHVISKIKTLENWKSVFDDLPKSQKKILIALSKTGVSGENNGSAKLKESEVLMAYDMMIKGFSNEEISKKFKVSRRLINRIRNRECWVSLFESLPENKKTRILLSVQRRNKNSSARFLSPPDVFRIRKLLKKGRTIASIARIFGVGETTIRNIRDGKTYTDV